MPESDFELVVNCIKKYPGLTGREIATQLRKNGHLRFTAKLVNQTLYRLLTADLINRDGSGDKPRWFPGTEWATHSPVSNLRPLEKRPLDTSAKKIKVFQIASTEVRIIIDDTTSPNDPYMSPDWVGSHVVASVNSNHPFWTIRLTSPEDRAFFCMFTAIDAYIQWQVARLHEPPDATELKNMRDYALRFCTLLESEEINSD